MSSTSELQRLSTLALRQRKAHLLRSLKLPPHLIHASLLERLLTCGRPKCSCHQVRKHGPFFYLSRCRSKGRMSSLLLKSDTQITLVRQAVQAYRQLLEALDQLSWINLELLRRPGAANRGLAAARKWPWCIGPRRPSQLRTPLPPASKPRPGRCLLKGWPDRSVGLSRHFP